MTKARDLGDVVSNVAWTTYTPTFTNFTLGNGTINAAKYKQIGKMVFVKIDIQYGSTSSISGDVSLTLPITSANAGSLAASFVDSGTNDFAALPFHDGTKIYIRAFNASVTYGNASALSSTVPFTWANNDRIFISAFYEAA